MIDLTVTGRLELSIMEFYDFLKKQPNDQKFKANEITGIFLNKLKKNISACNIFGVNMHNINNLIDTNDITLLIENSQITKLEFRVNQEYNLAHKALISELNGALNLIDINDLTSKADVFVEFGDKTNAIINKIRNFNTKF